MTRFDANWINAALIQLIQRFIIQNNIIILFIPYKFADILQTFTAFVIIMTVISIHSKVWNLKNS